MKNKKLQLSRRRFLSTSAIATAGVWAFSQTTSKGAVRRLIEDTCRPIAKAGRKPAPRTWDSNGLTAAWLGHSSVLINVCGFTVLTDPVLRNRVGASTPFGTIGAKRFVAPALAPHELPPIDLVLLSHAHMDHLDFATINSLPGQPKAVTARGMDDLLVGTRVGEVRALGWGEQTLVGSPKGEIRVKAFEVKHWGARWRWDTHRGYNGYVLEREGRRIIFGGDTAMTDSFRELHGSKGYDAAIMPIGAYQPWLCSHCSPEQAVTMADSAGADRFLPIHFKTFPLGREGAIEPMERLTARLSEDRIGWQNIGQTVML